MTHLSICCINISTSTGSLILCILFRHIIFNMAGNFNCTCAPFPRSSLILVPSSHCLWAVLLLRSDLIWYAKPSCFKEPYFNAIPNTNSFKVKFRKLIKKILGVFLSGFSLKGSRCALWISRSHSMSDLSGRISLRRVQISLNISFLSPLWDF